MPSIESKGQGLTGDAGEEPEARLPGPSSRRFPQGSLNDPCNESGAYMRSFANQASSLGLVPGFSEEPDQGVIPVWQVLSLNDIVCSAKAQ